MPFPLVLPGHLAIDTEARKRPALFSLCSPALCIAPFV